MQPKKTPLHRAAWLLSLLFLATPRIFADPETLPPLKDGTAPQTFEEMWTGFDPRAEPLEVEVLREWEEDGVALKVLRYRIGVFKGRKAMMAAVYGAPKGGSALPGLVQIHGGGQFADFKAPLTNAKRGYATVSIAWAGRISAPGYQVGPAEVQLFWENRTTDPLYKRTTDWGVLDGYHAPSRHPANDFPSIAPAAWTLDAVESPRNSPWFLCALGARRALTFLEQQPEVDRDRLGVYGHSMGGKLTVATTAADSRVKAAAPSCGGISDRHNRNALFRTTLGDDTALRHVNVPIIFLSPSNDFHGRVSDLPRAVAEIPNKEWRITSSPHHNHQDTPAYEVATQLWLDQHLKGSFTFPHTPQTTLELKSGSGIPVLTILPDNALRPLEIDVFYTQQGDEARETRDVTLAKNRFWHHAKAVAHENAWTAQLPLSTVNAPLWVYANISYPLEKPVAGAGYYYGAYTANSFVLSSLVRIVPGDQLQAAGIAVSMKSSNLIETFTGAWEKEWFTYKPGTWARSTHKLHDPLWHAPAQSRLVLDVRCEQPNKLVLGLDGSAAEVVVKGGPDWQTVSLSPSQFHNVEGAPLADWTGAMELSISPRETLRSKKTDAKPATLGGEWKGADPQFRALRWSPTSSRDSGHDTRG